MFPHVLISNHLIDLVTHRSHFAKLIARTTQCPSGYLTHTPTDMLSAKCLSDSMRTLSLLNHEEYFVSGILQMPNMLCPLSSLTFNQSSKRAKDYPDKFQRDRVKWQRICQCSSSPSDRASLGGSTCGSSVWQKKHFP